MADHMSFLPEDYLEKKIARRTNVIFVGLFAVVLTAVLATDFVGRRQSSEISKEKAKVAAQLEEKRRQFEQIEKLKAQEDLMKRKANVTAALRDKVLRSNIFTELINNMPATLSLTQLSLETKAQQSAPQSRTAMQREALRQAATGQEDVAIVPTDVEMILEGVAPTDLEISEYIGALNAHPLFSDVVLQYVEEKRVDDDVLRKFRMEMRLDPDFDSSEYEPTRADRGLQVDPMGETLQINPEGEMVKPTQTLGAVETE